MNKQEILNTSLAKDLLKYAEENIEKYSIILSDIAENILLKRGISLKDTNKFCKTIISHFESIHKKEIKEMWEKLGLSNTTKIVIA